MGLAVSVDLEALPLIQALHYHPGPRRCPISLIVVHTMEGHEKPRTARGTATWLAGGLARYPAPVASAHYLVDAVEIVRGVRDEDVALHAPGANACGLGIEHAGRAGQTAAEWRDAYSEAMLRLSADLVATLCVRYGIPARHLAPQQLQAGESGITGHAQVSAAWHRSSHWDPGPEFPWQWYLELVAARWVRA